MDVEALKKRLHAAMTEMPKQPHPGTGEPFVSGSSRVDADTRMHHTFPPSRPTQTYTDWDEDDCPFEVTLSDEEFAKAMANYEKAQAEWNRTCGMFIEQGQRTITGRFETASGSHARGVFNEETGEWHWIEWATCHGR